jgi:2-oxoglutarate dehydrogenase complex dihydrolipoamide succinyltransferase (E2) component
MAVKIVVPHMGESIVEGTVLKWLKQPGDRVERDESVVEVGSDKIDVEVPSPVSGTLKEILVREGETVPVGKAVALIEAEPATQDREREASPKAEARTRGEKVEEARAGPVPRPRERPAPQEEVPAGRRRVTPVVAKLVERHGIGLDEVEGTGLGGRVTKKDILAYLEGREEAPAREETAREAPRPAPAARQAPTGGEEEATEVVPLTGKRKAMAEHLVRSKQTAPHVTTVAEVDMTRLVRFREKHKAEFEQQEGIALTYMPFIVMAAVRALKDLPSLNASMEADRILLKRYYHIGIAVALEEGLVVPVIRHADRLDIRGLAHAIHDLAERARSKKLTSDDLEGGTFSITNPGAFGAVLSTPIIHYPQAAILGVEAIRKVPAVRDDQVVVRQMMFICLSYDHRIVDGATAVRFNQRVRRILENPLELIL